MTHLQPQSRTARYVARFNAAISVLVWLPAWIKMFQTHSAHDYALASLLIIFWLQISNLGIAIAERTKPLILYLAVNTATVAFTCLLVWWFQR